MRPSLRQRFLVVALLSAVCFTVSLVALAKIMSQTYDQRHERAREVMRQELILLQGVAQPKPAPSLEPTTFVGMRAGYASGPSSLEQLPVLDALTRTEIARAIHRSMETGELVQSETLAGENTVMVTAGPASSGQVAWVAYALRPPVYAGFWRAIIGSLAIATALLIATAASAVVSVQRGAAGLRTSLQRLATDLGAPISRPTVSELGDVADGIAALARELAHAQEEKERLGVELARQDRLAALGRVAAGVAHEVRNPLASIKLRVDLGRNRQGVPPQLAKELASVSEEVTRLDRLVADLLIVAGRRRGPRAEAELGSLVRRRVGLLAPWADERGVRIEVEGQATASLDVDAVSRAVDNLIRNAVEASPPEATVEVQVQNGDGTAKVRVLDRGAGVDESRLKELFEPFFTTKPEGTGLGLALSRSIAMSHEGTLTYQRDDSRTCFELRIPVSSSTPAEVRS